MGTFGVVAAGKTVLILSAGHRHGADAADRAGSTS